MASTVSDITTLSQLETLQSSNATIVLFFWASWHELSSGQLKDIFGALAKKYGPSINFCNVEAEAVPDISEKYEVSVVPTFIALKGRDVFKKLEGANPQELNSLVKSLHESISSSNHQINVSSGKEVEKSTSLNDKLARLIHSATVMVFIKGTPSAPRCGFSRQIVEILQKNSIEFGSFDILSDEEVRQGLKTYSDWPTYPQLYVHGKLIGGLDIVKELEASGDLKKELGIQATSLPPKPKSLEERLKALISSSPVMLFMKGTPSAPKCGFSRKIVEILNQESIEFGSFDILTDEDVRQGLKTLSDWPTYPQLYANGKLMGGLDVVNDMKAEGPLREQFGL